LIQVDVLIKIYPKISGEVKLVGIIKRTDQNIQQSSNGMSTTQYLESMNQFILTDKDGSISNVTYGLMETLGLHPAFFNNARVNRLFNLRIDQIAPLAIDPFN
jgi:hypothetical protein